MTHTVLLMKICAVAVFLISMVCAAVITVSTTSMGVSLLTRDFQRDISIAVLMLLPFLQIAGIIGCEIGWFGRMTIKLGIYGAIIISLPLSFYFVEAIRARSLLQ